MKQPARNIRTFINAFDMSGFLTGADLQFDQETPVVTTFADDGPRRLVANYDHQHKLMGLFDGSLNSVDQIVHALLGSPTHYVCQAYERAVENTVAYEAIAALTSQPRSGATGGAVLLNVDLAGSDAVARSLVLRSATLVTAGNGTGRNMGTTLSGQALQAVFRVLAFTGTSITLTIEESQNDGGADPYALIAGMTSGALTGPGVVRTVTTAATEAWKRVAASGVFSSALVLVTVGRVAGA